MLVVYLLTIILVGAYLLFHPKSFGQRVFSTIFIVLFVATYFIGGALTYYLAGIFGSFKGVSPSDQYFLKVFLVAFTSLLAFIVGSRIHVEFGGGQPIRNLKALSYYAFFLSALSIILYIKINGLVLFKEGGYVNRYDSN